MSIYESIIKTPTLAREEAFYILAEQMIVLFLMILLVIELNHKKRNKK